MSTSTHKTMTEGYSVLVNRPIYHQKRLDTRLIDSVLC